MRECITNVGGWVMGGLRDPEREWRGTEIAHETVPLRERETLVHRSAEACFDVRAPGHHTNSVVVGVSGKSDVEPFHHDQNSWRGCGTECRLGRSAIHSLDADKPVSVARLDAATVDNREAGLRQVLTFLNEEALPYLVADGGIGWHSRDGRRFGPKEWDERVLGIAHREVTEPMGPVAVADQGQESLICGPECWPLP
jgi:hypothetical protein